VTPTDLLALHEDALRERLEPAEEPESADIVVPAAGAKGVRAGGPGGGIGAAIGDSIGRRGAVKGEQGSLASGVPVSGDAFLLALSDRRLTLWHQHEPALGDLAWEAPRDAVERVERKRRYQLMAKFVLHFTDGSAVTFMTMRRATIDRLSSALGGDAGQPRRNK